MTASSTVCGPQQQLQQQQLEERRQETQRQDQLLQPLWLQLPQSQSEFAADSASFRETLERCWKQLQILQNSLNENNRQTEILNAQLPARQQAADTAEQLLQQRTREQQSSGAAFEELLRQRASLLTGRTVDEVLQEQRQTLTQTETERDSANTRLQLLLQRKTAADTSVDAAKAALEQMKSEKQQAAFSVARWMQNFETETGLTLNEQSLQRELAVPAEVLEAEQRPTADTPRCSDSQRNTAGNMSKDN